MSHSPPQEQFSFSFASNKVGVTILVHTFGHLNCPACDATRDRFMYDAEELSKLHFRDAAAKYLQARKLYLKPRTWVEYEHNGKQLAKFFGEMRLYQIHVGHLQEYQQHRSTNACEHGKPNGLGCAQGCTSGLWRKPANASKVNHEMSFMQSVLKQADQWDKIEKFYEPLRTPGPKKPKTLTDAEEMRVFTVAATNPDWNLAYWVASITCNTGAAGTELRHLRLMDLHLDLRKPCFDINPDTAKNDYRGRTVLANETACKQLRRCLERANKLGSARPEHYLFPQRIRGTNRYDPTKPASASWLAKQWKSMREAAGFPWLTPHCFRHQNATLRIEMGQPIELAAIALGHSAASMTRKYVHGRENREAETVDAIDPMRRFAPSGTSSAQQQRKSA